MKTQLLKYLFFLVLLSGSMISPTRVFAQTFTYLSGGLSSTSLTSGTSKAAIYGFSIQMTGSVTFKQFNIQSDFASARAVFANGTLYRSSTNTYSSGSPGTPVGNVTFNAGNGNILIDNFSETITNTTNYYFLVVDVINSSAQAANFYINSANWATDSNNSNSYAFYSTYRYLSLSTGTPYTISVSNQTSGLTSTSTTLTPSYTDAVLFSFSVTNNSSSSITISGLNISSNLGTLSNYFTSLRIVSSTTSTYPGTGSAITGSASGSYATFSSLSQSVSASGGVRYFWLVANRTSTVYGNTDVQFSLQSGQSSTSILTSTPASGTFNTGTAFGNTFNVNAATVSVASVTTGTQSGTITATQTDVALFGFSISATSSITVTGFNINSSNTPGSYFTNGRLYSNTSATFVGATPVSGATVTFSGAYAQVSGLSLTVNSTTKYYFLVADNNSGASSTTIAFNFTSGQTNAAVVQGVTSTYNSYSFAGNTLTLPSPTLIVANNSNGISSASLISGQTDAVLFGFSAQSFGTTPNFTTIRIKTSGSENQLFTNGRLYRSTSSSAYPGGTATYTSSAISISGGGYIVCTVNETIPAGSTYYYWFVADVNNTTSNPVTNYTFGFQNGQAQLAFTPNPYSTSYNSYTVTGQAFNIGGIYDWAGSSSTAYATAANWRVNGSTPSAAPSSTDLVRIGVNAYQYPYNQPTIPTGTTIGKLTIGVNNTPVITLGGTLTVTNGIFHYTNNGTSGSTVQGNNVTITAPSITVGDGVAVTGTISGVAGLTFNLTGTSAINLTGDVSLIASNYTGGAYGPATLVISGATTLTCARVLTTNIASGTYHSALGISSGNTLNLTGSTPFVPSSVGANYFVFGGTVNYSGTNQTVFVDLTDATGSIASYNHLIFSGSGAKTTNVSGTIKVTGDFTTANAVADFSATNPSMSFLGSANQTITNNSGSILTWKNVSFGTTASTGATYTKTLAGTSNFAVADDGVLTITNAGTDKTIVAAGSSRLTLKSGITSSATVATIPNPGTSGNQITGTVSVERYFTGGTTTSRAYRLISSPVNTSGTIDNSSGTAVFNFSTALGYPTSQLYTGGPGGTAKGFTTANAGASTVFLFRENTAPSTGSFNNGNYRGIATLNATPFNVINESSTYYYYPGGGMMIYYVGSTAGTNFASYKTPDNATAVFSGTLNQGPVQVKLWYNASTTFSYTAATPTSDRGFTMVGNPYASTIDWDTFSTSSSSAGIYGPNLSDYVYVYNYLSKNYGAYQKGTGGTGTNNASRYIASGQGFLVKATGTGASLKFNEAAKTTTQPYSLGSSYLLMGMPAVSAQQQLLRVKLAQDDVNTDDVMVLFENDAADTYELEKDVDDMNGIGNTVSLSSYSKTDNKALAINHMHSIDSLTRIRLFVNSTVTGTDTLKFSGVSGLDKRYVLYLLDHYKKDSVAISQDQAYTFKIDIADNKSFGGDRFELVFHKNPVYAQYRLLDFTAKKLSTGVELTWKVENEGNFTGFTIQRADGLQKFITFQSLYSLQSNDKGVYTFLDKTPLASVNKYRLMQNDAYEKISYSDIITIDAAAPVTNDLITLYPNPVVNQLQINLNKDYSGMQIHLMMMNTSGQVFLNKDIGAENINQNVSSLLPGSYVVELSDPVTRKVIGRKKFIKI